MMHSSSSCSMYASHVRTGKNCYQYIQILATHCSNIFTKANQSRYHNKQYYKLDSIDFTKPEAVATSWICLRCSWHWIVVDLSNSVWPFITLIFHEKLSMTFNHKKTEKSMTPWIYGFMTKKKHLGETTQWLMKLW